MTDSERIIRLEMYVKELAGKIQGIMDDTHDYETMRNELADLINDVVATTGGDWGGDFKFLTGRWV